MFHLLLCLFHTPFVINEYIFLANKTQRYVLNFIQLNNNHTYNLDPDHLQLSRPGKIGQEFGLLNSG